jgi:hypothetical protein
MADDHFRIEPDKVSALALRLAALVAAFPPAVWDWPA